MTTPAKCSHCGKSVDKDREELVMRLQQKAELRIKSAISRQKKTGKDSIFKAIKDNLITPNSKNATRTKGILGKLDQEIFSCELGPYTLFAGDAYPENDISEEDAWAEMDDVFCEGSHNEDSYTRGVFQSTTCTDSLKAKLEEMKKEIEFLNERRDKLIHSINGLTNEIWKQVNNEIREYESSNQQQ